MTLAHAYSAKRVYREIGQMAGKCLTSQAFLETCFDAIPGNRR